MITGEVDKFTVTFYPDKKKILVSKGVTVLSAAISAGVYIHSTCGGDGVCGRCKVIIKSGTVISAPTGRLSLQERKQGYHLACLATIESDLEVEIPEQSRASFEKLSPEEVELRMKGFYSAPEEIEESEAFVGEEIFVHSPLATKLYLELPPPNLDDKIGDLERLYREIRRKQDIAIIQTGLSNIRNLSELLRSSNWGVTVTLGKRGGTIEVVLVEPDNTSSQNYGLAFDIGTTTISGQLIDLNRKNILGTKITYNKQAAFGNDVITRIIFAQEGGGLEKLHHAVVDGMNEMAHDLIKEHNIDQNNITCALCAGNATMVHLLLKIDPTYIRREPYVPTANYLPTVRAGEAGIKINPRGLLSCVPGVSSYVGGDTVAGILSCGMDSEKELCLLIDVGTNGEMVLGNKEFLISCAASAGPAFEGSGVSCGMRSSRGAIQRVKILPYDAEVGYETISNSKPRGICGSGYIDIISQMLTNKLLDKAGKIKNLKNKRVRKGENGMEFIIAFKDETETGEEIYISEADIENIKRAKAAIFAGSSLLLKHMSLNFNDVKKIFIAGGFGTYLNIANAKILGLLPDLDESRFIFVGNSSLAGARQALLSYEAMKKADEIAGKVSYFELSVEPEYMDEYIAASFFPHTDLSRFPNVKI
ncbi:MAG: ASKHA domain-containing protein [Candidatus Omnitrophica bacterium]|nr:ASKHA domain-containing protein [Candidatus Omnitrophota bacterium]MDD5655511.1 ASKHA domain-containing protein [Candidatus Omnitrophota bacterium]